MTMARFGVTIQFVENVSNDTKWPYNFLRSKVAICIRHTCTSEFSSVSFYGDPFLEKVHWKCIAKWPWYVQNVIKNTNMHATYTPETQIFVRFTLWLAIFEYRPFFQKSDQMSPQMTLTCSRLKIPICMLYTPPRPKFLSVSLYNEPIFRYAPFSEKST